MLLPLLLSLLVVVMVLLSPPRVLQAFTWPNPRSLRLECRNLSEVLACCQTAISKGMMKVLVQWLSLIHI